MQDAKTRRRQQRSWYWYDWANSAYVTTTGTVLISPYLISLAENDVCPDRAAGTICEGFVYVLGIPISPGSLGAYVATFTTIVSALLLIFVGAIADRHRKPHLLLGGFAWTGALAGACMFFLQGTNWQLGIFLTVVAGLCIGSSLVVYDGILCRIATPNERDGVSSRGWALGYLGGGLLLAANLGLLMANDALGISTETAVRISMLSAGVWWGVFTIIPVWGLRDMPKNPLLDDPDATPARHTVGGAFKQLATTFKELRNYPQTLLFLLAYLFFNDGIQTVIVSSSTYGLEELQMSASEVMIVFLIVQFVAFGGALLFGKLASVIGAKRTVLGGIVIWLAVVVVAFFLPIGMFFAFVGLGVAIGLVMGGTQALSRSLYSQLVPAGRESEYFSLYQAMERGTSWFGTLTFGLVHQFTHSYRLSIVALIFFFVVGGILLTRVKVREGIIAAGNEVPDVV